MNFETLGLRREERWVEKYDKTPGKPTRKINELVVTENVQAILNDEEAAWLLKNYPDAEWHEHPEGDMATVIDGRRLRVTKEQMAEFSKKPEPKPEPKPVVKKKAVKKANEE